jgi:polyvinyl alcohol dehydrogenase (cytochrome)
MFEAESAIRSGVVVGGGTSGGTTLVFFGDTKANVYAVDAITGKLAWKTHPEEHPAAMITGAPNFYDGAVYFGISSLEEVFGGQPKYECCTFRGSVVALNASTGATLWKTYTISDAPKPTNKGANGTQRRGPSGAGVWSAPTIDVKRNAIYVATGDNYSDPPTDTSDAVLALDRSSGKLLWSRQMTANDAYNLACYAPDRSNCPDAKGPDLDFGQPPMLVSLSSGKDVLVIGQKSAVAWAIDPDQQGKVLWQTRVGKGGSLGGSQWGSAADGHSMYVSISDLAFLPVKDPAAAAKYLLDPATGGGLFALDLLTGNKRWSAPPPSCGDRKNCSPAQPGAVSAIPGVVFLGSLDGHFRAYSSETGEVVWDFDAVREFDTVNGQKAHGGSMDGGGAAISGGIVYVNTGYDQWGEMPGNALLAFSLEGN